MMMPAHNVLSWGVALQKGLRPGLYPYQPELVPLGEITAVLDFKIWAKKIMGISCYFTEVGTGRKFQLTVYCDYATGRYGVKGSPVDFAACSIGATFVVAIGRRGSGKPVIEGVSLP